HHQQEINLLEVRMGGFTGRFGVDGQSGVAAAGVNALDQLVRIAIGLEMEDDQIASGLGEGVHVAKRLTDHEVTVEGKRRLGSNGLHHNRTHGDVRDEVTVHHVEV